MFYTQCNLPIIIGKYLPKLDRTYWPYFIHDQTIEEQDKWSVAFNAPAYRLLLNMYFKVQNIKSFELLMGRKTFPQETILQNIFFKTFYNLIKLSNFELENNGI